MHIVIGLAFVLILGGMLMCWLSASLRYPTLVSVAFWTGVVLFVVGMILLLARVIVYLDAHLRAML